MGIFKAELISDTRELSTGLLFKEILCHSMIALTSKIVILNFRSHKQ
jgi:hypothetical protein